MKASRRCLKCGGNRIGRIGSVLDQPRGGRLHSRTIGVTRGGDLNATRIEEHGAIEVYVCVACGYFEQYVIRPDTVPWEKLEDFTWSAESSAASFR